MPQVKYGLQIGFGTTYGLEEAEALMTCLREGAPSCGHFVHEFETAFAQYCGARYAVAVTSATAALTLTGIAAGLESGDEVITTPLSWIATASAFAVLGVKMVFCDVDERTLCMDPNKLEALISEKTKLIVPVHLYGRCAPMDEINAIAKAHGILVVDDCAHNPGGEYKGKRSGTLADMSCFSFHQQKNMSTLGEGGMVTMNDQALFETVLSYRSLCCRNFGQSYKYLPIDETKHPMGKRYWELEFDHLGYNYRMTDAQACVGLVQLKKLNANNARRAYLAQLLTRALADEPRLILPEDDPNGKHAWHIYMVQLTKDAGISKEDFMYDLYYNKGVKAWSHYLPIHLTAPFRALGHKEGECPVMEDVFSRFVTLPLYPALTDEAILYMAKSIKEALQ